MKTITETIQNNQENEIINEALIEKNLKAIAKQLKSKGDSFTKIVTSKLSNYRWDLISDADVKVYNDATRSTSDCRKIISYGNPGFIVTMKDGQYTYIFDSNTVVNLNKALYFRGLNSGSGTTALIRYIESCDKVIIYSLDKDVEMNRFEVSRDRLRSREGMVVRYKDEQGRSWNSFQDYAEYCESVAKENVKRYKEILAKNRAKKDKDIEILSARVQDLLNRVLKVSTDLAAGTLEVSGSEYRLSILLDYFYSQKTFTTGHASGDDGILVLLSNYIKSKLEILQGKSSYNDIDYQTKLLENTKNRLEDKCRYVEMKLNEYFSR